MFYIDKQYGGDGVDEVDFYLEDLRSKFNKIKPDEYFLSYSGGRDSHFLYWFIKEFAKIEGITIVAINTYMEHPEIRDRMYKYSDKVLLPKMKPFEVKEKYGSPCFSKWQDDIIDRYQKGQGSPSVMKLLTSKNREMNRVAKKLTLSGELHRVSPKCCTMLKKNPSKEYEKESGKKPILGVRGNESRMRELAYTSCFTKTGKFTPLFDLEDDLMDKIYAKHNIETPEIYKYIKRTGCMGCPYGSYTRETQAELLLIPPQRRKFVKELFKESYAVLGVVDLNDFRKEIKR